MAIVFGVTTHAYSMDCHQKHMESELTQSQLALHNKIAKLHTEMEQTHRAFAKTLTREQRVFLKKSSHGATHGNCNKLDHEKMASEMNLTQVQIRLHDMIATLNNKIKEAHDSFVKGLTNEESATLKKLHHGSTHGHVVNGSHH